VGTGADISAYSCRASLTTCLIQSHHQPSQLVTARTGNRYLVEWLRINKPGGRAMLKITTERDAGGVRFRLEGKLTGPWVGELKRSWYAAAEAARGERMVVDLGEVTFIDVEGKKLLSWMYEQGAQFRCTGCMTKGIVEEIQRERRAPEERPLNGGSR
jgi:hypothetical protein